MNEPEHILELKRRVAEINKEIGIATEQLRIIREIKAKEFERGERK